MQQLIAQILSRGTADGDPAEAVVAADWAMSRQDTPLAAALFDRAYGLNPQDGYVLRMRQQLLDGLSLHEHGLHWRYVPQGTFQMGSSRGEPDERPVHDRMLQAYWVTETPITWADLARVLGWPEPPETPEPLEHHFRAEYGAFFAHRLWELYSREGDMYDEDVEEHFDTKPLVGVPVELAEAVAERLSTPELTFALPSEAQWERAARGGLIGCRYPWGDSPPDDTLCDFDHLGHYELARSRDLPANGYGLRNVCGGVWEWTTDAYDALAYTQPSLAPTNPEGRRVIRGGCFLDCAAAVTVSFRGTGSTEPSVPELNQGFRLVRRRTR